MKNLGKITEPLDVATKEYVDSIAGNGGVADSGWIDFTLTAGFIPYGSGGYLYNPSYRKVGNTVNFTGAISPTANGNGTANLEIGYLPSGFRPLREFVTVHQGSGVAIWIMRIHPNGRVTFERYRNGTTYADYTTTAWLSFNVTFLTAEVGGGGTSLTIKSIYPVGIIKEFGIDFNPNTCPEWTGIDWTWERFAEGVTTVGYKEGDADFGTIGAEGGSKDAVVVSHGHSASCAGAGAHNHVAGSMRKDVYGKGALDAMMAGTAYDALAYTSTAPAHAHTITVSANGVSGVGKNLQPYIVTSKWIRTA